MIGLGRIKALTSKINKTKKEKEIYNDRDNDDDNELNTHANANNNSDNGEDDEDEDDDLDDLLANMDIEKDFNMFQSFRTSVVKSNRTDKDAGAKLSSLDENTETAAEKDSHNTETENVFSDEEDIVHWETRYMREDIYSTYYKLSKEEVKELNDLAIFLSIYKKNNVFTKLLGSSNNTEKGSDIPIRKQWENILYYTEGKKTNVNDNDASTTIDVDSVKSIILKRGPILLSTTTNNEEECELILLTHGFIVAKVNENTNSNKKKQYVQRSFHSSELWKDVQIVLPLTTLGSSNNSSNNNFTIISSNNTNATASNDDNATNKKGGMNKCKKKRRYDFTCANDLQHNAWIQAIERIVIKSHAKFSNFESGWQYHVVQMPFFYEAVTGDLKKVSNNTADDSEEDGDSSATGGSKEITDNDDKNDKGEDKVKDKDTDDNNNISSNSIDQEREKKDDNDGEGKEKVHQNEAGGKEAKNVHLKNIDNNNEDEDEMNDNINNDINKNYYYNKNKKYSLSQINRVDSYNSSTPLHYAIRNSNDNGNITQVVDFLLQAGANCNIEDGDGKTPMYYAELDQLPPTIIELLEKYGGIRSKLLEAEQRGYLFGNVKQAEQERKDRIAKEERGKEIAELVKENKANKAKQISSTMNQNLALLNERGEKINEMSNKAYDLNDNAKEYADLAGKLKEKIKKKKWYHL